jgi:integrase
MPRSLGSKPHVVRRKLANGTVKEYSYARRSRRVPEVASAGTLGALVAAWQRSPSWDAISKGTRAYYTRYLRAMAAFMDKPLATIERKHIIAVRDLIARGGFDGKQGPSPGAANNFIATCGSLFVWGIENGLTNVNPATRVRLLKKGTLPTWTEEQYELVIANAPEHLRRALMLALNTGQRKGDLVRMTWAQYDGTCIRLKQGKTTTPLVIPLLPGFKAELDYWKTHPVYKVAGEYGPRVTALKTLILTNAKGKPWFNGAGDDHQLSHMLTRYLKDFPGLPRGFNIHGLRKAGSDQTAEGRLYR